MNTIVILLNFYSNFLEISILMLGSFLIGYFFNKHYYRKKYKKQLEDCQKKYDELEEENLTTIRAVKTVARGGKTVAYVNYDNKPRDEIVDNITDIIKPTIDIKDDLKKIKGIGPLIEIKLNKLDITTYKQISNFTKKEIDLVNLNLKFTPKRIENAKWQEQAKKLI